MAGNLYDPDGTRVELMEFQPSIKPGLFLPSPPKVQPTRTQRRFANSIRRCPTTVVPLRSFFHEDLRSTFTGQYLEHARQAVRVILAMWTRRTSGGIIDGAVASDQIVLFDTLISVTADQSNHSDRGLRTTHTFSRTEFNSSRFASDTKTRTTVCKFRLWSSN